MDFHDLRLRHRKVGLMEFGLNSITHRKKNSIEVNTLYPHVATHTHHLLE